MTDREQDREAFEKWARDHHYPLRPSVLKHYPIRPIGHAGQEPEYGAWDTDAAWQAWQAATAAAAERIAQLTRECDEARRDAERYRFRRKQEWLEDRMREHDEEPDSEKNWNTAYDWTIDNDMRNAIRAIKENER